MTNRIFAAFLLATFTLPALAQQSTSKSSDQSAPAMQSPEGREPLADPKGTDFWDGDQPNLWNLVAHPFVNKAYVQRYTGPIKDRLNELDEIRSENANKIQDINGRSQSGIQLASEKVSAADQHASEATSRAQGAQSAATEASSHVSRVEQRVGNLDHYAGGTQTEIRFRPGQTALSKSAKDALDELAAPLKNQKNYVVEVRGFSSGHGSSAIANSAQLADSVTRYLVLSQQIPTYRVRAMGLGNPPLSDNSNRVSGGRVEVNILRNDQVAAAQQ